MQNYGTLTIFMIIWLAPNKEKRVIIHKQDRTLLDESSQIVEVIRNNNKNTIMAKWQEEAIHL